MKNVGIGKLLFCLLLFSIIMLKSQITYANWSNLSVDELVEQSDCIFIGQIVDKNEEDNDSQEDIPGVKWSIRVFYTLKGEMNFDYYDYSNALVNVITPPKNQSTYYSLGLWSNKVLIFANKVGKYYSPISPQGVIQIGLKDDFPYSVIEEVISGTQLMKSIKIIDTDVDKSYKEKIEEFIESNLAYSSKYLPDGESIFNICGTPPTPFLHNSSGGIIEDLLFGILLIGFISFLLISVIRKYIRFHHKKTTID
mgnify:CR=1 FL=1